MTTKNNYVPRVNQIDALHLNKDITRLIRENLLESLQAISPTLFFKIQPELDFIIQSAIWFGSVGREFSTFGQQLLVLSYDSERLTICRLCLHFALSVLPQYIKNVISVRSSTIRMEYLKKSVEWGENAALVLTVLNFFRFLKTGRRPTLIDYLLGLDYISLRNNQRRDIGYKYLTRELLWGGFMEILGLVLPIINFRKIHRLSKQIIFGQQTNIERIDKIGFPKLTATSVCVYCEERPTLPHHLGCGHIYCYYCLSANMTTDSNFICTVCNNRTEDTMLKV
ncbi:peroxisome biogenesis factor 2 [Teleopsis dalmanni]|uniref:peroxisome biogenesis factor 2 n=1 Tax=Teleopsis dalmanni TaxID=139649 RepID=UPI0018CCE1B9|nr:peroxisome biogenesis factor 2 [Teleopsis dalmanni]